MSEIEPGQVWKASSDKPNRQTAHYMTIEVFELTSSVTGLTDRHWHCLCLENGNTGLTSLGTSDSAVTWERIT